MSKAITAKNLSAQLQYRAVGNPPSTLPDTAISNAFPGLEMDFRNIWKRILEGIELHESSNLVVSVDDDAPPEVKELADGFRLIQVEGIEVTAPVTGPLYAGGPNVPLPDTTFGDKRMPLEWSNALAGVVHNYMGKAVECMFESLQNPEETIRVSLKVRSFFEETEVEGEKVRHAVIAKDIAPPGELTQSLCSPWQNDYRECACFYWAATRPDYVNVEARPDGTSSGNNWMEKDRTSETPNLYIVDDWMDPSLVSYTDLFRHWEKSLRFVIGGRDEPLLPPEPIDDQME
jgi:hypothetical protein